MSFVVVVLPQSEGPTRTANSPAGMSSVSRSTVWEARPSYVAQKAPLGSTCGVNVTILAWGNKPVGYQVSTQDRVIRPDNERRMARRMNPRGIVEEFDAGHFSFVSHPQGVVDLIEAGRERDRAYSNDMNATSLPWE